MEWEGWERADGTNTTWVDEDSELGKHLKKDWMASRSVSSGTNTRSDNEIELWTGTDIHNAGTWLHAQNFEEKLERTKRARASGKEESDPVKWARVMAEMEAEAEGKMVLRSTIKKMTKNLGEGSGTGTSLM